MQPETISFRQPGCEMYVQQLEKRLVIINISFCIEAGAMAPSNGFRACSKSSSRKHYAHGWYIPYGSVKLLCSMGIQIPSSVVRNRSIARVRHRTHRVLYSSMVAALADFYLVTVVLGLRARKCRLYPGDKYRMACIAHRSWDGE